MGCEYTESNMLSIFLSTEIVKDMSPVLVGTANISKKVFDALHPIFASN